MTDVLTWASTAVLLLAGMAAGGEARAHSTDSLQVEAHAASPDAVDGWQPVAPSEMPPGTPDTLWISPESVTLRPAAWQRLTFRIENQRPVLTLVPGLDEQAALRGLLRDRPGAHLVVQLDGTVRYATPVLSIEGTTRSIKLIAVPPDRAARMVQQWQQAHHASSTDG
jgi:hypothetical protein